MSNLKQWLQDLQQRGAQVSGWLAEIERLVGELNLFFDQSELLLAQSNLLMATPRLEEAYPIVQDLVTQLFPDDAGTVYVRDRKENVLHPKAAWGRPDLFLEEFGFIDCWALRRGHSHAVTGAPGQSYCSHVNRQEARSSLCVPLVAQGQTLGILHLQSGGVPFSEPKVRLAEAVASHTAMALANLWLLEALREAAILDPLLGIYTRRHMEDELGKELARATRHKRPIGVIMFDIDHFKRYNTDYTHPGADELLRALGEFLKNNFCRRKTDIACRYGGEEFVLLMPEATLRVCQDRAEELRDRVKELRPAYQGKPLPAITISGGVAVFPDHGRTPQQLLQAAATALRSAKEGGRDRIEIAGLT